MTEEWKNRSCPIVINLDEEQDGLAEKLFTLKKESNERGLVMLEETIKDLFGVENDD